MRYNTTIKYNGNSVTIKVTNNALSGSFELPEFLKAVRISRNHSLINTHLLTDFPTEECEAFENGTEPIPKLYLRCFALPYKLPMKISHLGYDPKSDSKSRLANRLKEERLSHEIPQTIFAAEIGVARSTYAGYETGKSVPDIYTLIKIADYYQVSVDYLLGRSNLYK